MRAFTTFIAVYCSLVSLVAGSTLQPQTEEAYARYVEEAEKGLMERAEGRASFSHLSESPARMARLRIGQTVTENLNEDDDTPKGIIHDWTGAIIVRDVSIDEIIDVLTDYDSHEDLFGEVIESRTISRSRDSIDLFLRFRKKQIVTVVTDTWHRAEIKRVSAAEAQILSRGTRIQEVKNHGEEDEIRLPEGQDRGFLWRMNTYWSLEKISEGVLVECRTIVLSRDVPFIFAFIVKPIIRNLPGETMTSLLETLKKHLEESI